MGFGNKRFRKIRGRQKSRPSSSGSSQATLTSVAEAPDGHKPVGAVSHGTHDSQEGYEQKDYVHGRHHNRVYKDRGSKYLNYYDRNYKKLLIIPIVILLLAFLQIGHQYITTGDFMEKGVSLKGGVTVTVPFALKGSAVDAGKPDVIGLGEFLKQQHPDFDINIRTYSGYEEDGGFLIEADASTREDSDKLIVSISEYTKVEPKDMSVDLVGSALGESFFRQTFVAMIVAYIGVTIIVFAYFRTFLPSFAVVLAGFSTIIETLAFVNILDMKVTTSGIAAFLMLIGYSIDTDILLTVRVLKRKEGDVFTRIIGAIKTGLTMNFTTMAAVFVGIVLSQSAVLTQILSIIFIGMCFDIINTWVQNVALLRIYSERKGIE